MTGQDPLIRPGQSAEGMVFCPRDHQELAHAIGMAFDYRGDVTIKLRAGQQVTGYVFDCNAHAREPYLRLFVEGISDAQVVHYVEIKEIVFSGEDTAFGRSWDDWAKKWSKDSSPQ